MAKPRSHRDGASDGDDTRAADDASVFRAAVRDVKPLTPAPRAAGMQKPRKPRRVESRGLETPGDIADTLPLISNAAAPEGEVTGVDELSFRRPGVRPQVLRRLRRGLYPIENELDLHGLSQAEARDRFAEFIGFNRNAGRRCVRIVHGKGYRSGARGPILKIAVNLWLRRHSDVIAFTSARAIDGGTGAVYVLLRA